MFNSSMDTLHFMVEVRATGWIGFGVATQAPTNMSGYDVTVGGVFNGSGYIEVERFPYVRIVFKVIYKLESIKPFSSLMSAHYVTHLELHVLYILYFSRFLYLPLRP